MEPWIGYLGSGIRVYVDGKPLLTVCEMEDFARAGRINPVEEMR